MKESDEKFSGNQLFFGRGGENSIYLMFRTRSAGRLYFPPAPVDKKGVL
jgi:hypothetical protein